MTRWLFTATADLYAWMTAQHVWRQNCRDLAEQLPSVPEPLRVVDLGCGAGESALECARLRPQASIAGVDVSRRMLCRARRQATWRPEGNRLIWIHADGAELPLKANSIDAVTGHSVLYLVGDRAAVLKECLRVLRPGGRLILMEPNDRALRVRDILTISADPRFLLSMVLWRPISFLYGRFTRESLDDALRSAGFARCRISETLAGLGLCACAYKR